MRHLLVLLCLFSLASCQRSFFYRPAVTQTEASQGVYNQGVPSLRYTENGIEFSLELTANDRRDMNLNLHIRNHSDSIFNFTPDPIRVTGFNEAGGKTAFKVFNAPQYRRRQNGRIALAATTIAVGAVAGGLAIANAIRNDEEEPATEHEYDGYLWLTACTPLVWTTPGSVPQPVPGANLLQTHSIYPGEAVQGVVKVLGKSSFQHKILVEVPINGVYKQFVFGTRSRQF